MFEFIEIGSQICVWYADGCSVGSFDSVDEFDVYVSGVRIPLSIVVGVDGPAHGDGPCDDYRCCVG